MDKIVLSYKIADDTTFVPDKETCNFMFLCTNKNSQHGGVGRLLVMQMVSTFFRRSNKYTHIITELAKDLTLNISKEMKDMLNVIGMDTMDVTMTHDALNMSKAYSDQLSFELTFMAGEITEMADSAEDIYSLIDLNRTPDTGTITCTRKNLEERGNMEYAPNGSRYVDEEGQPDEHALKCGSNKGWSNPYASNYLKNQRKSIKFEIFKDEEKKRYVLVNKKKVILGSMDRSHS